MNLKKSWHTGTLANQERVWKAEQKAEEEKRRVEQMLKEKKEEREKEDLRELQKQAGLIKRGAERVEWMYTAPNQKGIVDEEKEAFLLGKRRADKILRDAAKEDADTLVRNGAESFDFSNTGINMGNRHRDMQNKTRDDPLLAIKKREAASLRDRLDNPIALKRLKEVRFSL